MFNPFQLLYLHSDSDSCPLDAEILLLKIWLLSFFFSTHAEDVLLLAS